jgi:VWFA-related protein
VLTVWLRRPPRTLAAACVFACALWGADPSILPSIRVDSRLVLIPVSVTDSKSHAVVGLGREAFRVFEGHSEQPIVHFAREDAPLSVGIVFDASGSMRDKLPQAREAVARFLAQANPEDEFFLVSFDTTARIAVPFTRDAGGIQSRLLFTAPEGRTALLDAVVLAMDTMKRARNPRKALLVISDGGDNNSRYSESEIRHRAQEADLWIYAIGIRSGHGIMLPEGERDGVLPVLAEATGGRYFPLADAGALPDTAAVVALDLHNQYVIGYQPAAAGSGKYHRVQVKVAGHDVHATWRPGYYE